MLHTLFKAESSSDSLVFANSTYQRLSAFFFPAALSTEELIWTRMLVDIVWRVYDTGIKPDERCILRLADFQGLLWGSLSHLGYAELPPRGMAVVYPPST